MPVEQAAVIERLAELTARVEALEAAADGILWPERKQPPATASSLLEQMACLLAKQLSDSRPGTDCTPFARDVLRLVADWLEEQENANPALYLADAWNLLTNGQEANRG